MGMIFRAPAILIMFVFGLAGLWRCFNIIQDDFGTFAAVICLILAPPVLALIPWYEGIVNGNWEFLTVLYGAAISAGVLMYIGGLIDKASGKSKKASGKDGKDVEDEDKQNGLMTHRYERGEKKLEGYYKDGELDGLWTEWYLTGEIKSKTFYENGKEDGLYTIWHKSGKKKLEKHFKNGKEDGLWTEWSKDGKKTFQGTFKDGNEL